MYVTLDSVKAYLAVDTTSDDELITEAIESAQAFIESPAGAGRVFEASADTTRRFDGPLPGAYQYLTSWERETHPLWFLSFGRYDLAAITSVTNGDGTNVALGAFVTLPHEERPWYGLRLKLDSGVVWTWQNSPESAIAVTGRWAYSITPPPDIKQACRRLASWYYKQRDTLGDPQQIIRSSDGTTVIPQSVPRDVLDTLIRYRRLV